MQISKSFFIVAIVPQKLINVRCAGGSFINYLAKVLAAELYQVSAHASSLQLCFQQKRLLPLQIHLLLSLSSGGPGSS